MFGNANLGGVNKELPFDLNDPVHVLKGGTARLQEETGGEESSENFHGASWGRNTMRVQNIGSGTFLAIISREVRQKEWLVIGANNQTG